MSQALDKEINGYLPILHDEEKKWLIDAIKSVLNLGRKAKEERISK